MARYSLAGYTIRAKINDQYAQLGSVDRGIDIIDIFSIFQKYFEERKKLPPPDRDKKIVKSHGFKTRR